MSDSIILFLDDDNKRAAILYQKMTKADKERTIWTSTVPDTIGVLRDYRARLDVVSLEHDLGDQDYVNTAREDCGMEIVRWLEHQDARLYSHVRFIVHTWNIKAAEKMAWRLIKKGYRVLVQPFGM